MSDGRLLTQDEIAAIEARLARTIPGPWYRIGFQVTKPEVDIVDWAYSQLPPAAWDGADESAGAVLDFIAHSREDIPRLIAMVAALQADRDAGQTTARENNEIAIAAMLRASEAEADRDALAEALRPFADIDPYPGSYGIDVTVRMVETARAALARLGETP